MDRHANRNDAEIPSEPEVGGHAEDAPAAISPSGADPGDPADLRRKRRRAFADRLLALAEHLPTHDRTLIEASYRDALRVVELAALVGGREPGEAQVRAMRRRIRVLVRRLLDPRFEFVVHALANTEGIPRAPWSPLRARVAREFYLQGRTMRAIAAETRESFYSIRRHRDAVEALFDMHTKRGRLYA
jgi:hypothetical protein